MIKRRKTRTIRIGRLKIGSGYPIAIQSMAKTKTGDISATINQIKKLEQVGCEIIRVAVRDIEDANSICQIKKEITIPLVADIHFDYKLAIASIKNGADKIRINPGNIFKSNEIDKIIEKASSGNIPIRIGINSGSLRKTSKHALSTSKVMVDSGLDYLKHFQKRKFNNLVISLKASDIQTTVEAYRRMAKECDYPLHLGITATGLGKEGIVKSSIGIGSLLLDGIGDTIRVSLTSESQSEVETARDILASLGLRNFGPKIIACPTCGRCQVDLVSIVKEVEEKLKQFTIHDPRLSAEALAKAESTNKLLTLAIMGCEVNGPGEAKGADIGIAFGKNKGAIFKSGRVVKTVEADKAVAELLEVIRGG